MNPGGRVPPKNPAIMKARTYAHLNSDPRVDWISDERGSGDGIWVYLKEGFINMHLECGTIHEHTIAECCQQLNDEVVSVNHWKTLTA